MREASRGIWKPVLFLIVRWYGFVAPFKKPLACTMLFMFVMLSCEETSYLLIVVRNHDGYGSTTCLCCCNVPPPLLRKGVILVGLSLRVESRGEPL
jgi:hypothetical protein